MIRKSQKMLYKLLAYIRHPFGVTCLHCGFLAISTRELISSERIMLQNRGQAGCPVLAKIFCFRSLWIDLDLAYTAGYPDDEILDKVNKNQRHCRGFFKYKPGWSPSEHQGLLTKSTDRKKNLIYSLFIGFIGGVLAIILKWLATKWDFISP